MTVIINNCCSPSRFEMIWKALFIYGMVMPSVLVFINAQDTSIIKAGIAE